MIKKILFLISLYCIMISPIHAQENLVWKIGDADNTGKGMALYPNGYSKFLENDFGYEDRFFAVGFHDIQNDWPFIHPGPENSWGGTSHTAGIRSHSLTINFQLPEVDSENIYKLLIDILDTDTIAGTKLKVSVNEEKFWKFDIKRGEGKALTTGMASESQEQLLPIEIKGKHLRKGNNTISLSILEGGWIGYDQIKLISKEVLSTIKPSKAIIQEIKVADYERKLNNREFQPLLVKVLHLQGEPEISVWLDQERIFSKTIISGTYNLEAPMPPVEETIESRYQIKIDGQTIDSGTVLRSRENQISPAEEVSTLMGTGHSRWMIAPGPWMPFGMVKLSPDNQNGGWQAGYDPTFESIGTFSHIHEWTMAGLGTFPTNGELHIQVGDESDPESGYRSRIDKNTEEAPLGYYKVDLIDSDITALLTSTTRASFQKYTFKRGETGRVMVDLSIPAEYAYQIQKAEIKKVSDYKLEGYSRQLTPNAWSGGVDQDYIVHFVMEFDQPIKEYGSWINNSIEKNKNLKTEKPERAGMYVEFDTENEKNVQVRTGISYVSIGNAALNLREEISKPFAWNFEAVVDANRATWNDLLGRLKIESDDQLEYKRFYTNMYRALASRNIFSDVDGRWRNADEEILKFDAPQELALSGDAFWNTFWNLNQFWNLVTPEWSSKWVKSQLAMYDSNGWLAKGPAGMEYIPVMVAEHEIPLIVGAYQMGIRDFDAEKAFEAAHKMQTTPATKVGGGLAGNRDLETYLKHKYVPYDEGRFSNSLEYSFDDWTLGQFAKSLGKDEYYQKFSKRGSWWKNVVDTESGFAKMKDAAGNYVEDFDPFKSGANHHYVEGNAWQLSFFVPQDVPGLVERIGKDRFLDRLEWGFEESYKWRFNGPNDQYWDFPVVQGNQQSMHFAFLFNWAGKPWLTQKWSRSIMERFYGYGEGNAYLGDEDQGQMSAWFIMNALGLFQTDGGTSTNPIYEIGSPIFPEVTIDLNEKYGRGKSFTIKAKNVSRKNKYIQKATLNQKPLNTFWFYADELLEGGELMLEMGPQPNKKWGAHGFPKKH